MLWGMTKLGKVQKITWKYGVEIVNWPTGVQFQAPSKLSARDCSKVVWGLRRGTIQFRHVPQRIMERYAEITKSTVEAEKTNVGRVDKGSKHARNVKTTEFVMSEDEA